MREITDLHSGQTGGLLWVLAHPLLLFAVYSFLFTVVLKVRIGSGSPADYTLYLFSGLAPWFLTQDVMTRATHVLPSNVTIVKKVMFPLEALVAKSVLASLIAQSVMLGLVLISVLIVRDTLPASILLLAILVPLHLSLLWGIALALSSITPYFRDTAELVRMFLTVGIFLVPVMYLPQMVPGSLQFIIILNPFSYLIWCYQDALYFGQILHPMSWLVTAVFSAFCLMLGSFIFLRLRHHISSIL
jgi:lipopolysaccharide transport system permease protein